MTSIRILGPRDKRAVGPDWLLVDTTSRSTSAWTTELSPFHLGPCPLYGGHAARRMENAWQFAKVYSDHVGPDGEPTAAYWRWARQGWGQDTPVRYPRGKGAKPAYLYWDGGRLGYVEGRLGAYWPLYRDAVAKTAAFARLQQVVMSGRPLALFDFDGFDHDAAGVALADVLRDDKRPMGHAFVLKAMLLHGPGVTPQDVLRTAIPPTPLLPLTPQIDMFAASAGDVDVGQTPATPRMRK